MNNIVKSATNALSKTKFQLQKHQPEIMVIGGVIGGVVAAVMACKATTKASEVLAESKDRLEQINTVANDADVTDDVYSEEDHKRDLVIVYTQTAGNLVKLYAPAVILGGLSIASILGGHNILQKRNMALAAAYATLNTTFKDYRDRVVDRFGKDVEYQIRHNLKAEEITEKVEDPETGKTKKVKKTVFTRGDDKHEDGYSRLFDAACDNWNNDAMLNRSFLAGVQNYCNDKLRAQGYLFLSDIYKQLGFRETPESRVVGWRADGDGDGFVDFGFDQDDMFMSGYNKDVWLDFNVDGPILETFPESDKTFAIC